MIGPKANWVISMDDKGEEVSEENIVTEVMLLL
jgi:hypothetical protein